MSKLYLAEVTVSAYIWAGSREEAEGLCMGALGDEMSVVLSADRVDVAGSISPDASWAPFLPYGQDPTGRERTVGEVLGATEAVAELDAKLTDENSGGEVLE